MWEPRKQLRPWRSSLNLPSPVQAFTHAILLCTQIFFGPEAWAAGTDYVWQMGTRDDSAAEFVAAVSPRRSFAETLARFPGDRPYHVAGMGDVGSDWPGLHPGPKAIWGGWKPHTFTVAFALSAKAATTSARLAIDLAAVSPGSRAVLQIVVNGEVDESIPWYLGPGENEQAFLGATTGADEVATDVPLAPGRLREGINTIAFTVVSGDWVAYDWIGLEVADGVETQGQATPKLLQAKAPQILVEGDDGEMAQLARVSLLHVGAPQGVGFHLDGELLASKKLATGYNRFEIPIGRVLEAKHAELSIRVEGFRPIETDLELERVRPWEVYMLPHSHVDIGYTALPDAVEKAQWQHFETALDLIDASANAPEGAQFKWNVEVLWAVDSYLEQAEPEKKERFLAAVRTGRIGLDALYGNALTGLAGGEELFALTDFARNLAREEGLSIESAMLSDVAGYAWGLVPALARTGVRYLSAAPNHMPHQPHGGFRIGHTLEAWGDRPFYWQGPSPQDRILFWMPSHGYSWFLLPGVTGTIGDLTSAGPDPLLQHLSELEQKGYSYDMVQLRYAIGIDNGPPDTRLSRFVSDWNDRYASPRLIIATTSEMFRRFEHRYGDDLPVVAGEFSPYWEDGSASTAKETALARRASDRIVRAETLWAMTEPAGFPSELSQEAWRNVLLFNEHTWGGANSGDFPEPARTKGIWEVKRSRALNADRLSTELLEGALAEAPASKGSTSNQVWQVINTESWPRTDLVVLPKGSVGSRVVDEDGEPAPSQVLSDGRLAFLAREVPAMGAALYRVVDGEPHPPVGKPVSVHGSTMTSEAWHIVLDAISGDIAELVDRSSGHQLVDKTATFGLNALVYSGANARNPRTNGQAALRVVEAGPLVLRVALHSKAPGSDGLVREVQLVAGLDRLEIRNTLEKAAVRERENVRFAFPFALPGARRRVDQPWAMVEANVDQLDGANHGYLSVGRGLYLSSENAGVVWTTLDAPLVELAEMSGESWMDDEEEPWPRAFEAGETIYSWVMNNSWRTNYKATQQGPVSFRYALTSKPTDDPAGAKRASIEAGRPLLVVSVGEELSTAEPLIEIDPDSVLVSAARPLEGGILVRLFNASDQSSEVLMGGRLARHEAWTSDDDGRKLQKLTAPPILPPWGILSLRFDLENLERMN